MQKVDKRIENHNATTYKTRHYSDQQITHLNESANAQEKQIAKIFYRSPDTSFGPTHIHQLLFPNFPASAGDHPITSTRRAINNLTTAGILRKTDSTTSSLLGGVEHQWRWRSPQHGQDEVVEDRPLTHRELLEKHAGKQMQFHEDLFKRGK